MSFPRKRESILLPRFWITVFRGNDRLGAKNEQVILAYWIVGDIFEIRKCKESTKKHIFLVVILEQIQ